MEAVSGQLMILRELLPLVVVTLSALASGDIHLCQAPTATAASMYVVQTPIQSRFRFFAT